MKIIEIENIELLTKALTELKTKEVRLSNVSFLSLNLVLANVIYVRFNFQNQIILGCQLRPEGNFTIDLIDFTIADESYPGDPKENFHQKTLAYFFYHERYPEIYREEGLILEAQDCGDWGWSLTMSPGKIIDMEVKYDPQDLSQVKKIIANLIN